MKNIKQYLKNYRHKIRLEVLAFYSDNTMKCRNCGYVHTGKEAPDKCPACKHPQAFYELLGENY
jgi:rubrerythrin